MVVKEHHRSGHRSRAQSIGNVWLVSATFLWQRLSDQDDEARGVGL
jgi:hypothetical protein